MTIPIDEPYLGREAVFHFDQMIQVALGKSKHVAAWLPSRALTPLQKAGTELIPHSLSIALGIRELVRTGYLFPAEILTRPLVERVAVISYLADAGEEAVSLWERGWPYTTRPSLAKLLAHMEGTKTPEDEQVARQITQGFNSLIHADPLGAYANFGEDRLGSSGFLIGPTATSGTKCDDLCFQTAMYLVILSARMIQIFPQALEDRNSTNH